MTRLISITVGVLALVSMSLADVKPVPSEFLFLERDGKTPSASQDLVGKPLPEFALGEWFKGNELTREDMKGKIVVVDVWATWCGPCIAAMPKNEQLSRKFADQGVVILGICSSQGQERMSEVLTSRNVTYFNATDPDNNAAQALGVRFFPTYILVDRAGLVRGVGVNPDKLEEAIKFLLAEEK